LSASNGSSSYIFYQHALIKYGKPDDSQI